jgi:hypothetical protein
VFAVRLSIRSASVGATPLVDAVPGLCYTKSMEHVVAGLHRYVT